MKRSDTTRAVERFLRGRNISDWHYDQGGKHPRVVVSHAGRTVLVSIPSTSRNWNSAHDTTRRLRRALGLVGKGGCI